jgi:serpin B
VVADEQAFALDLLGRLGPALPNLVLSPSSIATVLAMLEPGAAGATATAIARTLHSPSLTPGQQARGWDALAAAVSRRAVGDHIVLDTANQAWFAANLPVLASYLRALAADFHTGAQHLGADPAVAARAIDAWVAAHTGGHITQLVTEQELEHAVAVLVDAIYMKAAWATAFDVHDTAPAPFHVSSSKTVQVQTMETPDPFEAAVSVSPALDAVDLPYRGDNFSALVLMPPLGRLAAFEKTLTAAQLSGIVAALRSQAVDVYMPRFSVTSDLTLNQVLSAMGMGQAFTNAADFSNLSSQPVKLSYVVHDAQMKVNENGTEASAATAVIAVPTAVMPRPALRVVVDHPFLFLVRDDATGLIIFETQVGNPA